MKIVIAVACLLAVASSVRGMDEDDIIAKYMDYLMPDVKPCADQFHVTDEQASNIQKAAATMDLRQLGCLKACVMKRMSILTGLDFHLEPIYKMIEVVHVGNDNEIADVKTIAEACVAEIQGETDECNIGNKYTDCYIAKLFN